MRDDDVFRKREEIMVLVSAEVDRHLSTKAFRGAGSRGEPVDPNELIELIDAIITIRLRGEGLSE